VEQPPVETPSSDDSIAIAADMRPVAAFRPPRDRPSRGPWVVAALGAVLGLAGLGAAAWTNSEAQREILRLSTELAQLRVSLDLYARSGGNAREADVAALAQRLSILEQSGAAGELRPALPAVPASSEPAEAGEGAECLPPGMRLLVAVGDSYPVCGQTAAVDVGVVDNGYISLADGTTVPSGSTVPMPGSACTISVTSSGDEGLTGYAEIRVNC
jgi:hypothetical protein